MCVFLVVYTRASVAVHVAKGDSSPSEMRTYCGRVRWLPAFVHVAASTNLHELFCVQVVGDSAVDSIPINIDPQLDYN